MFINQQLLKLSVFDKPIELLLEKQNGHRTYLGVLFTLTLCSAIVLYFYGQLQSSIEKTTPQSEVSLQYTPNQSIHQLNKSLFTLEIASNTKNLSQQYEISMSLISRNQSNLTSTNIPSIKCGSGVCIDWDTINSLNLFGSVDSTTQQYLEVHLTYICLDGLCGIQWTDEITLKLTSSYVDSFQFPRCNFQYNKTITTFLASSFQKQIDVTLTPLVTQTDNGYVIPDNNKYQSLQASYVEKVRISNSSFILKIELDNFVNYRLRSYLKIQDVLGNIGGLWQILFICFSLIMIPYNNLTYKIRLLNEVFNFQFEEKSNKVTPFEELGSTQTIRVNKVRLNSIMKKTIQLERQKRQYVQSSTNLSERIINSISDSISNFFKNNQGKLSLNFCDYLKCVPCRNGKGKSELMTYALDKITQNMDIVYIMKKLQEIDKLKSLLLNKDQVKLFDFLPKPTISSTQSLDQVSDIYTIFKPQKSDLDKALEAQAAYNSLSRDHSKINEQLIDQIDEDFIELFKINLQRNIVATDRIAPSFYLIENMIHHQPDRSSPSNSLHLLEA